MAADFFGLDIGTSQIKVVQVKRMGDTPQLTAAGMTPVEGKGILSDSAQDQEALARHLEKFLSSVQITTPNCVSALSESQIFTRVIQMPVLNDRELASAIRYEAEQHLPVPTTEVNMAWQVLARPTEVSPDSRMDVLLIAAPKILVEKQLKILTLARLKPIALETEILAITRSLVNTSSTSLLISIGAYTTDICIVRDSTLRSTRAISTGGEAFTRAIAEELGFDRTQAEEYKKNYGLLEDQLEGKIASILKPVFEVILGEIKKAISAYESKTKEKITTAILSGGGAALPGIIEYLAEELDMEVQAGDPWAKLKISENIPKTILSERTYFAVATGLALKNI